MSGWIAGATDFFAKISIRVRRGSMPDLYREIFDTPTGRVVLADMLRKAGMMEPSIGLSSEHLQYATGGRDMMLYVLRMLRIHPAALQQTAVMETIDE